MTAPLNAARLRVFELRRGSRVFTLECDSKFRLCCINLTKLRSTKPELS
jgi:hypothetical protein